jgi:hypothetical protein
VDAYELIERHFPFDGPHSDESVTDAAIAAERLVRYMNNATWPYKKHVASGPAVYRVLSNINGAVYGLRQLLEQLQETTRELAGDESMYDDRRDRPARTTAIEAVAALGEAVLALGPLTRGIEDATSLTCHLGHETPRGQSS